MTADNLEQSNCCFVTSNISGKLIKIKLVEFNSSSIFHLATCCMLEDLEVFKLFKPVGSTKFIMFFIDRN